MGITPTDWRSGDLGVRWEAVLQRLFSSPYEGHTWEEGTVLIPRPFRFELVDVGRDGADLIVHAFFLTGGRYCCPDPVCQGFLVRGRDIDWERVRRAMTEECIDHLNPVRIRTWRVTIEEGARFFCSTPRVDQTVTQAAWSYSVPGAEEPEDE